MRFFEREWTRLSGGDEFEGRNKTIATAHRLRPSRGEAEREGERERDLDRSDDGDREDERDVRRSLLRPEDLPFAGCFCFFLLLANGDDDRELPPLLGLRLRLPLRAERPERFGDELRLRR